MGRHSERSTHETAREARSVAHRIRFEPSPLGWVLKQGSTLPRVNSSRPLPVSEF
ncbi:hypothetical protein [Caudoviricetes sp.]|nr:hypothetical protein [Caudoviricetes sp.]